MQQSTRQRIYSWLASLDIQGDLSLAGDRLGSNNFRDTRRLPVVGVLISHVTLAGPQGCRFMVRHTNAGASDLDRAYRPSRMYPSARKTPYT